MSETTNGRGRILAELAPADYIDPVVEVYKKDVDRTLLRENLKLTVEKRILKAQAMHASVARWGGVAHRGTRRTFPFERIDIPFREDQHAG